MLGESAGARLGLLIEVPLSPLAPFPACSFLISLASVAIEEVEQELPQELSGSLIALHELSRNEARFPTDFMFRLTKEEAKFLRSQFVISNVTPQTGRRGGRRHLPYAFTEQGVAMLSGVLKVNTR